MVQPIIEKSYLAELNIATVSAGTNYKFIDIPQLRDAVVYGISAYSQADCLTSPNQKTVINAPANILVTFVIGEDEEIYQMAYNDLRPAYNAGLIRVFKDKRINFQKSYITITNATGLNNGESVLFNFIYRK